MDEIGTWLRDQGLGEFARLFEEERIDLDILSELNDADLKGLGLPLGPRKRLLKAIRESQGAQAGVGGAKSTATSQHASKGGVVADAAHRQLTVMFCDMVGSTALSRRLDPEEFRDVILAYQNACTPAIEHFGGFVARHFGDGILAYFGFPHAHEDDAERAVHAGLRVVDSIKSLDVEPARRNGIELAVRIGIATGPVVVGDIVGEGASQESTALGETPNLASRLQDAAAPNSVVIAPTTRELLAGLFDYEDLGLLDVKGMEAPVHLWKVEREGVVESRFEAVRSRDLTPLVGRLEEEELLMRRWTRAVAGEGQVVTISGEAGIGKSRITGSLRQRLRDDEHTCLHYQCSPHHTRSALYPAIAQIERDAGFHTDDPDARKLDKLEELLRQTTGDVKAVAPLVAALLSLPLAGRYAPLGLTPPQQKDRTLWALDHLIHCVALRRPVLLVLEDAHWADPTTLEMLNLVLDQVGHRRMLAILTFRREFESPWIGEAGVTSVNLGKLSAADCAVMVQNVAGRKPLPDEVTRQIVDKTDGIPLFVEELTKTVLASGLLEQEGDRHVLKTALPSLAIPSTLQDSLMARLDRLPSVKELAQVGAVIGREFSHELIQAVSDLPGDDLDHSLARLVDSGLLYRVGTPPESRYRFKHALIQDTAYGSLLKRRRQALHARIAHALEDRFGALLDRQPELAAHHFSEARLEARALDYWHRAGTQAAMRSANVEAFGHFSSALAALDKLEPTPDHLRRRLDLLVESITPLTALKGYSSPELEEFYAEALRVCDQLGDTPQIFPVLYGRWILDYTNGRLPEALRQARAFHALASKQQAAIPAALARRCEATILYLRGDPITACEGFESVLESLDAATSSLLGYAYGMDSLVGVHSHYSLALAMIGEIDRALGQLNAAVQRAERLGHAQTSAHAHAFAGWVYSALREPEPIAAHADAVEAIVSESPMPLWALAAKLLHGCSALFAQRYETARPVLADTVAVGESLHLRTFKPTHLCHLAETYLGLGDLERALATVADAFEEIEHGRDSWYEAELHRIDGRIRQAKGDSASVVEKCYRDALGVARTQSARLFELRAAIDITRFHRATGGACTREDLLGPACSWFLDNGVDTADVRDATVLLAQVRA